MAAAVAAFLRTDLQRMLRDRFLLGLLGMALAMALAVRFILPAVAGELDTIDLRAYYPLFVSYVGVCVAALMAGAIGGFLLLESREEATVRALLVTPVPLRRYLAVLGTGLAVFAAGLSLVQALLIGLGLPPWPALFLCALCSSAFAPAIAFFLAGFAGNKVEAFAIMKILGVTGMIPPGAWFLPEPWQWLSGFYPPYLVCKAWWVAAQGGTSWPLWLLASLPVSAVYLGLFERRFLWVAAR